MKFRPLRFAKQTFTHLSGFKKRFLQLALVLFGLGAGVQLWAQVRGELPEEWTATAMTGGIGAVGGFLFGALLRLVAKLGLLLVGAAAGATWALAHFGLVDLPWESYGDIYDAFTLAVDRQTASLRAFLDGFLPSSAMTSVGFLAGITQRPGGDDDQPERPGELEQQPERGR